MNEKELLKILNKEKSYTEEDLLLFIYDLRKQNKELKEKIILLKASEPMLEFAKQTYKDNWNKLKEWLKEGFDYERGVVSEEFIEAIENTLDKMQEIEGGMNE